MPRRFLLWEEVMERPVSMQLAAWCTGVGAHGGLSGWVGVLGVPGGLQTWAPTAWYLLLMSHTLRQPVPFTLLGNP